MKTLQHGLLSLALLATGCAVQGQIISWDTTSVTGYGPSPFAPTTANPNLTVVGLTRGGGITTGGSPPAAVWGGTGFDTTASSAAAALAANEFVFFSSTANSGFSASYSSINANFRRTGTGPSSFQWQYSLDGTNYTNIGSIISYAGTDTNGFAQTSITLSGISALQNVTAGTTTTLRLVAWGATGATGNWGFGKLAGDDLAINGSVTAIPEPSTYAAIVGAMVLASLIICRHRRTRTA